MRRIVFLIWLLGAALFLIWSQRDDLREYFKNDSVKEIKSVIMIPEQESISTSSTDLIKQTASRILETPPPVPSPPAPKSLIHQPEIIKAIYLTSWSAGKDYYINSLFDLVDTTDINAVVIDIKDYTGFVAYNTKVPKVQEYKAVKTLIPDLEKLIKKLHDKGIYVIARVVVFQDPVLAKARPDLAVHSIARRKLLSVLPKENFYSFTLWRDHKGLSWLDPAAEESWNYIAELAKDAVSYGFDEINFDYIRFPSDGDMNDIYFPHWNKKISRQEVIKNFFKYLRAELPDTFISADLFGYTTTNSDDLGIGQIIEDGYAYFDAIAPMTYPSHYSYGFLGFANPEEHPYEVVYKSMQSALERLLIFEKGNNQKTSLRPWLQDFDYRVRYDSKMVKAEIQAVEDALSDRFAGFMLWNPSNIYTKEVLEKEDGE